VFSGKLKTENLNKCIYCKKNTREDIKHLFLYCNAWNNERRMHLGLSTPNENNIISNTMLRKQIILVLGGDVPAFGRKPADRIVSTCKFLSAISRRRSVLTAECIRENVL